MYTSVMKGTHRIPAQGSARRAVVRTSSPSRRRLPAAAGVALLALGAGACGGSSSGGPTAPEPPSEAVFRVRACAGSGHAPAGEEFRVLIRDPGLIAEAESLVGAGQQKIVSGRLAPGDGGFNAPWSWHLEPATVELVDIAIELCDGCPSFIEDDPDFWFDSVGRYCPWSTEVVARER